MFLYKSDVVIVNSTIVDNTAQSDGGGIYCSYGSSPVIFNSIIWDNNANSGKDMFVAYEAPFECEAHISYTDVNPSNCYVESGSQLVWGMGNINLDPLFVEDDSLFHLSATSPCINAGAESLVIRISLRDTVIDAPNDDFEGGFRPWNGGFDLGADEQGTGAVFEDKRSLPEQLTLSVYPNPFNGSVRITVSGPPHTIEIYDISGRMVGFLGRPNTKHRTPNTDYIWIPDESITSGIYFVRAKVGDMATTKKILYLK